MGEYSLPQNLIGSGLAFQSKPYKPYKPLITTEAGTFNPNLVPTPGESLEFKFDANEFSNNLNTALDNVTPWGTYAAYGLAGLQALTGLANAYTGYKNYKLAKEQFGFEKAAVNRNIANQAKQINNAYDSSANIAAAMSANGMADEAVRQQYLNEAKQRHVDGSKIG